ncbi:hypothetical protein Tco_0199029 [Tanacetum coccineum]
MMWQSYTSHEPPIGQSPKGLTRGNGKKHKGKWIFTLKLVQKKYNEPDTRNATLAIRVLTHLIPRSRLKVMIQRLGMKGQIMRVITLATLSEERSTVPVPIPDTYAEIRLRLWRHGNNMGIPREESLVHEGTEDIRATNIILQGLPKDIYSLINHYTDAKDIWDNVKMLLEGSELTKEDRESQLETRPLNPTRPQNSEYFKDKMLADSYKPKRELGIVIGDEERQLLGQWFPRAGGLRTIVICEDEG